MPVQPWLTLKYPTLPPHPGPRLLVAYSAVEVEHEHSSPSQPQLPVWNLVLNPRLKEK